MEQYSVNKFEIQQIKKELSKKIDINRLKLNQKLHFTVDQTNYLVKEFIDRKSVV